MKIFIRCLDLTSGAWLVYKVKMFNYLKKDFLEKEIRIKKWIHIGRAFSTSAISAVVLGIAYSLVNVILTSNKNDNTNIALVQK